MSHLGSLSAAQAAQQLGVSTDTIKRLCNAGKLACFRTGGNHLRIPDEAIEAFRRGGASSSASPATSLVRSRREAVEELSLEAQEIRARRQVDELREEDARERNAREAAARSETARRDSEREERRREQQLQEQRTEQARRRRLLQDSLIAQSMEAVDRHAAWLLAEERLAVYEAVQRAVAEFDLNQSPPVIAKLLSIVIATALEPCRKKREIVKIIDGARSQLPSDAKGFASLSEWEEKALADASEAVRFLPPEASLAEIRTTATKAGKKVAAEYERSQITSNHRQACDRIVAFIVEGEEARVAVKAELEKLPVGATRTDMERARDTALAPYRTEQKAARDAQRYLPYVAVYVEELGNEVDGEWDLGGTIERLRLSERMQRKVQPLLAAELLNRGDEEDEIKEVAERFIEEWVDRELGLE